MTPLPLELFRNSEALAWPSVFHAGGDGDVGGDTGGDDGDDGDDGGDDGGEITPRQSVSIIQI